jgi:hypothetical protein
VSSIEAHVPIVTTFIYSESSADSDGSRPIGTTAELQHNGI